MFDQYAFFTYNVDIFQFLVVGGIMFTIGILGIFLNKKNILLILMSIELMLLAVNINFIAFSRALDNLSGQVFVLFNMTVAAAEAAIGLAILVMFYRKHLSIAVEEVSQLKG